ncbi:MAG TPA: hypothetical protein VGF18_10545 [Candidatus Tumulicola sp.]
MRNRIFAATAICLALAAAGCGGGKSSKPDQMTTYDSETAATSHCRGDKVVWLNLPTGVYHYKGETWYGRTKHGAYACEKEAVAAGDHASKAN